MLRLQFARALLRELGRQEYVRANSSFGLWEVRGGGGEGNFIKVKGGRDTFKITFFESSVYFKSRFNFFLSA